MLFHYSFPIIAVLSLTFKLDQMSMTVFQSYIDNKMLIPAIPAE